jgi:histone chaperone ASF1
MIPEEDKIGVTVVLVTCSYRSREFVRVGYYVNNDYADPMLLENPPAKVDVAKLQRNILADKPRVTRFPIDWSPAAEQEQNANFADDDELVKAAAQLDHNYTDIVIDNNQPEFDGMDDDVDLEGDDDEELVEDVDVDGDQEMDDDNVEIDLDEEL